MLIVKCSYPLPGQPPGMTYEPVMEDDCHFYIVPSVGGKTYRIPHRNVYINNFIGEPQDHKSLISEHIKNNYGE